MNRKKAKKINYYISNIQQQGRRISGALLQLYNSSVLTFTYESKYILPAQQWNPPVAILA